MTGAAGCVGRALLECLSPACARVVGLDLSPPPGDCRTDEWIRGDILDPATSAGRLRGIDVVVHLAAMVHTAPRTKEDASRLWNINLEGTKILVAAAAEQRVRRFILVSTVAVLSPSSGGIESAYAESKRAAEREVLGFRDRIEVVVVRPATVYGPNDRGNVFRLIRWIDRGLPGIIGAGNNRKSLVFSRNLAGALVFLSGRGINGETYVVTDGCDQPMMEIVRAISRVLGKKYRWPSIPRAVADVASGVNEWAADRFGIPRYLAREMIAKLAEETVFDPEKLFSLGFKPSYAFEEGLQEAVRWYMRSAR